MGVKPFVTGFAKTRHNSAWTEIHFIAWHESHTLGLSRHTNDRAKDNQVCFHRQHFSDPVNPWRSMWCHWGALIRLYVVSASCHRPSSPGRYTVVVFVFHWAQNGWFSVPRAPLARLRLPPTPTTTPHPPPAHPPPIELIPDIGHCSWEKV